MGKEFDKREIGRNNKTQDVHPEGSRETSLPNSLVMRIMQDPAAENEADRLSQGLTSSGPDEVMREMGSRLGADFSNVRFHSDPLSMKRSQAMGARAWAQGSDVYFGKGGFDPKVAAHELVHTVQQGAVRGNTAQTAPSGAVQLFRGENANQVYRRNVPANASNLQLMSEQRNSSSYGAEVFNDLKSEVKKLAQKSGSRIRNVNADNGISFIANLGERDYSGKEILRDIAERTVINKDEQYDRLDEYNGFIDYMSSRTDKVGLEAASMQAGILDGQPKYNHNNDPSTNKRAYEMTEQELAADTFNPMNDTEVADVQEKIDNANSVNEAYYAFLKYTDNKEYSAEEIQRGTKILNFAHVPIPSIDNTEVDPSVAEQQKTINTNIENKIKAAKQKAKNAKSKAKTFVRGSQDFLDAKAEYDAAKAELKEAEDEKAKNWKDIKFRYVQGSTVNMPLLKAKLKNMVRQIRDYPELKHKIGSLNIQWNQTLGAYRGGTSENIMAVSTSAGAESQATIHYDAYVDRDSPEAQQERDDTNAKLANSIGNLNKVGNHELGHVLESTLNVEDDEYEKATASNDILQSVLPKVMNPQELAQVNYNQQDGRNAHNKPIHKGQIDTTSPIFTTKQMTSRYGQSMPKEWFAEAFHDVYVKGSGAKQTSIEIVKEYERRQVAKQKENFQKREAKWYTKLGRWFKKRWNFGRNHGDPDPAPQNANANQAPVGQAVNQNPQPNAQNIINQPPQPIAQNIIQNDDPLDHYKENMIGNPMPNAAQIPEPELLESAGGNPLDTSMIVENPKNKKTDKDKKKKKKKK